MTYATQADLETRFGSEELAQCTDRINGSVIDPAVVALALADAVAEIDGYLASRYQLPLASIPEALTQLTCDIARYRILGDTANEPVRKRYEDAVSRLKSIARGDFRLQAAVALADAVGINEAIVTEPTRQRIFNGERY